jgi:hypothetical protein
MRIGTGSRVGARAQRILCGDSAVAEPVGGNCTGFGPLFDASAPPALA